MRVLQLGPYPPPHGGVQTNLVAIREFLRRRGIACAVINLTRYRRAEGDGLYYPHNPFQVIALLLRLRYDIIHIHFGGNIAARLLALWLVCSLLPGKKTVLTFHSGGYPSSKPGKTARRWCLRGFIFRRIDRIIGVNQEMLAMFERFGVPPSRLRLISPHTFQSPPPAELRPEVRAFLQSHSPLLATVSGLEPEYDIPLQVEVLGRLLPRFPNLGLIVIGGGSLEREIRNLVASKPYSSSILVCGDMHHAETLHAIHQCNVMLRTTLYDGDSIAVREALDLGTPVVATDNGMRPAGVHLIPIAGRQECERAIERILKNPPRRPAAPGCDNTGNLESVFRLYRELLEPGAE